MPSWYDYENDANEIDRQRSIRTKTKPIIQKCQRCGYETFVLNQETKFNITSALSLKGEDSSPDIKCKKCNGLMKVIAEEKK